MFSNLSLALTPISTDGQTGWMHSFQVPIICFHSLAPYVPSQEADFSYWLLSGWIRQQLVLRAIQIKVWAGKVIEFKSFKHNIDLK